LIVEGSVLIATARVVASTSVISVTDVTDWETAVLTIADIDGGDARTTRIVTGHDAGGHGGDGEEGKKKT
jgi:hypothetical protein